jgi:hypothetical protein
MVKIGVKTFHLFLFQLSSIAVIILIRVGIALPTVEVRYHDLSIDAKVHVGGRALPTLWNSAVNAMEEFLGAMGIRFVRKQDISILHEVSGIIKPGRMTLLLGPPGSGKTSLLLALASKLDPTLKVKGEITYNGHTLKEFVPQKTSAYVSQYDLLVGEMTVRETLEFSAKCQGVGTRYELLTELTKREKELGIHPEADVDYYMKAAAIKETSSGLITDYMLKVSKCTSRCQPFCSRFSSRNCTCSLQILLKFL